MTAHPFLLSHLLENAAEVDASHVAVICGSDRITYGQLADRAARFAAALRAGGLRRGDRVAIHAAKSIDTVVAVHGAQWAGCVAIPIDPSAPSEAVRRIVEDAEPRALVSDERTAAFASESGIELCIGESAGAMAWSDVARLEPVPIAPSLAEDPAYILYTSGSTGDSKGIAHSHRGGLRYAQLAAATYSLTPTDRMANVAPFHFDQSTFELYAALVARSTIVLVPELYLKFPAELANLLVSEKITVWYSVPTLLIQLLDRGGLEGRDLRELRWVLFGGELFPTEPLLRLMELMPTARFSNVYGPTEVNQCTFHHLDGAPAADSTVPIGLAWDDTEVRLIDDAGAIVAGAGRGSLEVRTGTMMLGYWRRPELTAASTIVDSDVDGLPKRWYRTGDLVERDAEGVLTFLGRSDRQVKLRGHRIELEGVEAVLSNLAGVVSCAVVVDRTAQVHRLVGVIESESLEPEDVLLSLRGILPSHAVPSSLRLVERLPRTRSGKIDARAVDLMVNGDEDGVVSAGDDRMKEGSE